MPWKIEKKNDKFAVVEVDGNNPGKVFGEHDTKEQAEAQLKALYANTGGRSKGGLFYRYSEVEDGQGAEDRKLQLAFSSEFPVKRRAGKIEADLGIAKVGEDYLELLSHEDGHYDLSALNNSGALLDEHNEEKQIGTVIRAEVSKDKIGRAVVEFDGITDLSKTRNKQMATRSRPHVSFGYNQTQFIRDEQLPDGRMAKRVAWAADEISSVARPADPTVGSRRAAMDTCHCTRCGNAFLEQDLDDDYRCETCGPVARSLKSHNFKRDAQDKVTITELSQQVYEAFEKDERFHGKDNKGVLTGWISLKDLFYDEEVKQWSALIYCSVDDNNYEVKFDVSENVVTLKEETQVEPKTFYKEVEQRSKKQCFSRSIKGVSPEEKTKQTETKTRQSVDSEQTVAEKTVETTKIIMADNNQIDATKIRAEVEQEHKSRSEAVSKRNAEISDVAADFIKTYGHRWNGPKGQRYVCGERIRSLQIEAMNAPADQSASEVRQDFKRKAALAVEGSTEPKNQEMAADLPSEISTRCSLRNVYNAAARSKERSACFIPKDGAEKEAHDEIFHRAGDFPGGVEALGEGLHLPISMPTGIRGGRKSGFKRDALAGDFATAGALVEAEFIFPTIELLRNLPALSRAGITILSGVMGNLVLPRQEAATTVQSAVEGAALTQYDQVLGQIKMEPHRVGSSQNYSRLALLQTSQDFEAMVMRDHLAQIALYIDEMGINGQGAADQPTGILNQIGIGSVTFGGSAANAYTNMVNLETVIRKNNVYDPVSFISTSNARGTLRVTPEKLTGSTIVSGSTNAIWHATDGNETVIGRPAVDSQQVPYDIMICGAFRHFVMAQWGGLAVVLDTISLASSDKYRLSINTYIDFACRHAQAFSRSADSVAALS